MTQCGHKYENLSIFLCYKVHSDEKKLFHNKRKHEKTPVIRSSIAFLKQKPNSKQARTCVEAACSGFVWWCSFSCFWFRQQHGDWSWSRWDLSHHVSTVSVRVLWVYSLSVFSDKLRLVQLQIREITCANNDFEIFALGLILCSPYLISNRF